MAGCGVRGHAFDSSHSHALVLGLMLTFYTTLTSCVQPSIVNCESVSARFQHCGIHPAGVHDLDCFGKHANVLKKCVWKPGAATSEKMYTLITRQPGGQFCTAYSNISEVSENIRIFAHKNMTAEVFETSKQTSCTKAVFRGSANSWIRCGPPCKVTFQRRSGKLHVNVSWPQRDRNIITHFSVKYETLKSRSRKESLVQCQNGHGCVVKNLKTSLVYNVQIQCAVNNKCSQCPWSDTYTVPPELTTQPEIGLIKDRDIAEKKGRRLLFLTWTFSAREPYDGFYVTVGKASGEAPDERLNTTRPEITLVLSYSAFHVSISAVNGVSTSPAASTTIPQRDGASGARDGRLNVTVHSNKSFTVHWRDDLIKRYVCYSVEWSRKGHEALHRSFYERKDNYRTISVSSDKDHLEPYERYDITLHTRPNKETCNLKRVNDSESTYGSTQFYFAEGTPVSAPANISSCNATLSSVPLEWSSITEEEARGFLLGYMIHYAECRSRGTETNVTVHAESNRYRLEDLKSGTAYEVQISGFTRAGGGVRSTSHVFKTHHQGYLNLHLGRIIAVFAVGLAVLILGPVIIKRTKVVVWPSIPNPGNSNAMQKIDRTCELELLESIKTLKVEEWDTSSLQIVEKETVIPAKLSPCPHVSDEEGETCSWSQTGTEDAPGGLPLDASGAPHLQSSPLTYLSEYTTMEMFNQVMPRGVSEAVKSESEDADLAAVKAGLDYIRQFSSSPTVDSEVSTFL